MKVKDRLFVPLVFLPIAILLACGGSMQTNQSGTLQSITVSPAVADAKNSPDGQVQFTATGFYNTQPSPVSPLLASWGVCQQNAPTTAVTVTQNGVAQCTSGATGTFSVFAQDPPNQELECLAILACGGGCMVAGTAQLTCP